MPSESLHQFERIIKSEDKDPLKVNMVSTKAFAKDSNSTAPTYVLHCKTEPESLFDTSTPHTGSSLLVSSPAGGNLMLYVPEECNSASRTEVVTMEDHSTFNPNSPEAASPMSTTCSSAYSPSSPSVSMGVPSPSCVSRDTDLMLFDEDTISSLASILEEANEDRIASSQRTLKCPRTSIAQKCHSPEAQVPVSPRTTHQQPSVFNFGQATSNTQFIETNFNAVTEVANQNTRTSTRSKTKKLSTTPSDRDLIVPQRKVTRTRGKKNQSLTASLPSRQEGIELQIAVQPEKQHRARYLTEGSRGSVKDESQQGFPTLKLHGARCPVTLQVFVAADLPSKVKPHGYYQACKVTGRNTTPCSEQDVDGTTIIEIQWKPDEEMEKEDMEIRLDCVGILKLRNADVEQRIGLTRSKRKNTAVRLVFRVNIERHDGSVLTLQQVSSAVCCTQPLGHPEILKKSLTRCSVEGGEELFIIGKNFVNKNTTVKLQEMDAGGAMTWEGQCDIDKSLFHNTHIVCTTPIYRRTKLEEDVEVYLVVSSGPGKTSEQYGHPIYYYMPGAGKNTDSSVSSSEVHTTNSEGALSFDLESLHMPSSQENSMDAPISSMDVLNSLGQPTQQKETLQIQPETSTPSVARLDTSQMQLTMSQVQPVMTPMQTQVVTPVPTQVTAQLPSSLELVSHQAAISTQIQTPPVSIQSMTTPVKTPVKSQLDTLTAQLQSIVEPSLSSLLTPAASPKAVTVNSLLNQITSHQNVVPSTPTIQLSSLLQQQQQDLQQQLQKQQQQQQQQKQQQLLPAETLLQAAQSLQALQAQAVQMQALQPQVQAAAMQVSAQLQMHAQKLQDQLKQKEQQSQNNDIIQIQSVQLHHQHQQHQQLLQQQQISQSSEVSFADKLKAAAQMEVNQPGLLTKLAQQQNLLSTTSTSQQQTPVTILPTLPSTVCSVLNIQ